MSRLRWLTLLLLIGLWVYLADRAPGHAMWVPAWPRLGGGASFGVIGQWLPSFVHPFAFILLTACIIFVMAMLKLFKVGLGEAIR